MKKSFELGLNKIAKSFEERASNYINNVSVTLLLIFLSIICKFLVSYIKAIRTGDPNESELTYWMFSYDFKSKNKDGS